MASPKSFAEKLQQVLSAWQTIASTKSFGGMTLAQFQTAVQPSFDKRTALQNLEAQVVAATDARENADAVSNDKIKLVVKGVAGDPDYGTDSDLYEAMGYVRDSEKKSGLTRKSGKTPPTTKS